MPDTTVYVTKHALTSGIGVREFKRPTTNPKMIEVAPLPGELGIILVWKPYWHNTQDEALAHAEEMRKKKIASLRRQIAKLEKLRFEEVQT